MPFFDLVSKISLFEDDICKNCIHFMEDCSVWPDLGIEQDKSKWHDKHIVHRGEEDGRKNYVGCPSFRQYISPKDKQSLDPEFGKRISQQEANRMDGLPDDTVRPLVD